MPVEPSCYAVALINVESTTDAYIGRGVALVFPNERIAQHWNGALQASLKRAPLEAYLRSRNLKVAGRGPARDSDNISRATLWMLRTAMGRIADRTQALSLVQCGFIGQVACCVCDGLAALIGEPRSWRVAALVSTTQLMPRSLGLLGAATLAANSARQFTRRSVDSSDALQRIGQIAATAIAKNSDELAWYLSVHIATRLDEMSAPTATRSVDSAPLPSGVLPGGRRLL
jgi:hypothetical protein